jgi:pyruvate dehydrogenase E2 component (dihydrolipoamide acetyltransferase)
VSSLEEILLPDIGDFSAVEIIEILVAPGDRIEAEQSILTLESDKATIEVPAPLGGLVREVLVKVGERISQGDLLMRVESAGAAADDDASRTETPASAAAAQTPAPAASKTAPEPARSIEPDAEPKPPRRAPGETERRQAPVLPRPDDMTAIARGRKAHASPAVRRFARELGVDLARVKGSGPKGRIVKDDVQGYVKQTLAQGGGATEASTPGAFQLPSAPEVDFARFGPTEIEELPRIRKLSGRHLHRCWIGIPHVTQFDEADITELEAFRQAQKTPRPRQASSSRSCPSCSRR